MIYYDILQTPQLAQEHLDYQFQNWEEKQILQAQDRYEVSKQKPYLFCAQIFVIDVFDDQLLMLCASWLLASYILVKWLFY